MSAETRLVCLNMIVVFDFSQAGSTNLLKHELTISHHDMLAADSNPNSFLSTFFRVLFVIQCE